MTKTTAAPAPAAAPEAKPAAPATAPAPQAAAPVPPAPATEQPAVATAEATPSTPAEETKPAAQEAYQLALPDGSPLDPKALEEISAFARERGFSKEQAQAVLERESAVLTSYREAQQAALQQATEQWFAEVKADPELGGEAFAKNVELAKRVVARYGSEKLKQTLNESGLGNHPELVRLLVKIGKETAEDTLVVPRATQTPQSREARDVLFPEHELRPKEA